MQQRQFVFDDLVLKTKIRIIELAQWQPDSEDFQSPALHIAKPLGTNLRNEKKVLNIHEEK